MHNAVLWSRPLRFFLLCLVLAATWKLFRADEIVPGRSLICICAQVDVPQPVPGARVVIDGQDTNTVGGRVCSTGSPACIALFTTDSTRQPTAACAQVCSRRTAISELSPVVAATEVYHLVADTATGRPCLQPRFLVLGYDDGRRDTLPSGTSIDFIRTGTDVRSGSWWLLAVVGLSSLGMIVFVLLVLRKRRKPY